MNGSTILESKSTGRSTPAPDERFNALADPARISIMARLRRGPSCVCDLQAELGMASNLLSYHLRILREAELVRGTRRGRRVEYQIEPMGLERLRREVDRLLPREAPR
jgi:ArsR family transcriptional regulator